MSEEINKDIIVENPAATEPSSEVTNLVTKESTTVEDRPKFKKRIGDDAPPPPEGISKSKWKKIWRRQQFVEHKEEYSQKRREKRKRQKQNRRSIIQGFKDRGEEIPAEYVRPPRKNVNQKPAGFSILLDCGFDDLMNEKEVLSLSNQLTRAYAANRRADHYADMTVTSFNKRLEERFKVGLVDSLHETWPNFKFVADETLITEGDKDKMVYLTADTEETLDKIEAGMTYVVGGIVDKNRHKELCLNKAKSLGIPVKKLPIDEFIKIDGRQVLTTTHVVQLMLKYFDTKDWKEAFESVLPARKIGLPSLSELPVSDSESDDEHREIPAAARMGEPSLKKDI
ncbi:similar to Saccharomyces cerevisiae YOL093W TRM10 tRNA methyltransferase, methylates the N-1 position of guanosine in tRNAs [Maudiozyma barnettii]|uniref:tRNA (guanine(9)-N1)-methyltransferase n=1 Tax=Maudiozyma barnettii TaxID=61262 RepID=A0A8H2ZI84_9SACH|nr:tRNA (guanine(9)-N(1))-methyltransferase [Kazachstania barnettii]CAB4256614.1 similar to Saccharomyces cerevisiae YOL093W TRM10 tRNA methyltransferase, methylates the N-1 position of guanosine in tRNAs [Kazachstania barnettii]CAD1785217.1 similar to Saccharomyces cerevisiae YOL093W TRM10 tRNA methyltransferase, methylates the N-1 position of guanosine in tRNAs [Kazachstania barnettii]